MQQLTDSQDCPLAVVNIKDRKGNPTTVQNPLWASSDESILTLIPDPGGDPLAVTAHAVGALGAALVTFTADADLGDGIVPIIGTLDVVVLVGQAVALEIQPGTPVEQV